MVAVGVMVVSLYLTYLQTKIKRTPICPGDSSCQATIKPSIGNPSRLIIPAINVTAIVQDLGVTEDGAMDIPSNVSDVGWFQYGSRPGESGSAVIAGHLDGKNGEEGVFSKLNELKKGDTIFVEDDKGLSNTFVVRESRMFNPGYANEVFSGSARAQLNLITCAGIWNKDKKDYSKRLIVFTDMVPKP